MVYQKSCLRFLGWEENAREVEMDMREMVDKVKKGEPLYGETELSPYMQGIAARNSRYSSLMFHIMPMMNFVNHNQVSLPNWTVDNQEEENTTDLDYSMVLTRQSTTNKQNGN